MASQKRSRLRCHLFIYSIFIILLAGCASQSNLPTLVDPTQRFVQSGYSLTSTNENGWILAARSPYQLALAKMGQSLDETFAIQATLIDLAEFNSNEKIVEVVRKKQAADTDPDRFSVQKHDVYYAELNDSPCSRSYMLAIDNAAVKGLITLVIC